MKTVTGYILSRDYVVEELGDNRDIVVICYEKRSLLNRLRLWLSQKIRPKITAVISIKNVSEDEAKSALITHGADQVIPVSEYEKSLDNCQENMQPLTISEG